MPTLLLLLAVLFGASLSAQADTTWLSDGPYLMYDAEEKLRAHWADPEARTKGSAVWGPGVAEHLPAFRTFRPQYVDPDRTFPRNRQTTFNDVGKLAVVSDIHGQYSVIRKLLLSHGVMDEDLHWTFGRGHFVIVGDIFDRGPQVTETLWLIHNLQQEAAAAGGRVHFLLGNHETMVMAGDVRYVNKRYLTTGGLLQIAYQDLYGPNSYLGRWLRSLPLAVRINGMVFVHGGISKDMANEVHSITTMNDLYHQHLIDNDAGSVASESDRLRMMRGRQGPLWYRGYFNDRDFEDKDIRRILKKLRATRMIVGHTSFDAIKSFFGGKVIAVDSSIKFGSLGEILLIEGDHLFRGDLMGKRTPLFLAGM